MAPDERLDRLRRLRWHCRRGMRELDLLLGGYLEAHHPDWGDTQWRHFEALLAHDDHQLWRWLIAGDPVPAAGLAALVASIRDAACD